MLLSLEQMERLTAISNQMCLAVLQKTVEYCLDESKNFRKKGELASYVRDRMTRGLYEVKSGIPAQEKSIEARKTILYVYGREVV